MDYIWIIVSYLVGSIPFALIVGKLFKNIDVRDYGSGNLGGTNAIRVLGPKLGIPAGVLDILKAFIIVLLARLNVINFEYSPLYLGVIVSIGHCYPIFAKFKGGKAVSTTIGAVLAFSPIVAIISAAVAFTVIKITKYVSVGSTVLGVAIIMGFLFRTESQSAIIPSVLLLLFIMFRHIPNYKRLLSGNENKAKL